MHTATAFPGGSERRVLAVAFPDSSETFIALLPRNRFPFWAQGWLTHFSLDCMNYTSVWHLPTRNLLQDCEHIKVCQEDAAGLWASVGLKKTFDEQVPANSGNELVAEPWWLASNQVWSLCDILHITDLPAFPSTQITKSRCALSEVPLTIQFSLLKSHLIISTFSQGRMKRSL